MMHFAKPENALKRADELVAVGQKDAALVALHDVLSSKRHRTWQPAIEQVMTRFLDLCVEMRKGKAAKDGLIQYRIICQQINVASMETVLRHFMELSETSLHSALSKAEETIGAQMMALLDFEDLEAEETPESLMLATIGGAGDSKKRTDRLIVTPSLKFLWETFRTVLDILRNSTKLDDLYRDTASRAFAFCLKYKRTVEFRRVCEILRNHIQVQTKFDPKWKDREPPTPESLQTHLETRFAQLNTAVEMELWQEAYRTVEDVHLLLQQMKKVPKPSSMAAYYAQLSQIFWVADNQLFHAFSLSRLYAISKTLKAAPSADEMSTMASRAVLATLCIPPSNPVVDINLLEYDLEHEKAKRMAAMLSFPTSASRRMLLEEVAAKGLLAAATPEVQQLQALLEASFFPLDLVERAKPLLDAIAAHKELAQYDLPLRKLVALRMLQQMERVYLTIKIENAKAAISLLEWPDIEALIIWAVKRELLTLRIDYKAGQINQRASTANASASVQVRDSLSRFASSLEAVAETLHASDIERRKAEVRARLYGSIAAGVEEEHQKVLSRRLVIERRKEEQERITMEEDKERQRVKMIKQREEEAEEKKRLTEDATRREAEREEKARAEEEQAQMRKLAEQMAEQRATMKVAKKKGADKVEKDVDTLAQKDRAELIREQKELMLDERVEFEKRLESMQKRHDHIERARREEERELLALSWEEQQTGNKKAHVEQVETLREQSKVSRANDIKEKARFLRASDAVKAYTERVMAIRKTNHVAVVEEWKKQMAAREEQARLQREAEEAEEREREEAIQRARREAEEEEALRIQEASEAARKKQEEEEERKRVAERQEARERELEEKAKREAVERRAKEDAERAAARERAGIKSWAADEDDEDDAAPPASKADDVPEGKKDDDARPAQERRPLAGGRNDESWQEHRLGGRDRPPPARDGPPGKGGDRWEPSGGRGSFGDRDGPRRDFGDRGKGDGPPRRDFGDRDGPPRRDFGDRGKGDGPPRDFGDRGKGDGPPRRDFGDRDGPPRRDFGSRDGPPRDFGDRGKGDGPPRRDFGSRDGPPRDFGDRGKGDGPPRRDFGDRGKGDGPPRRDGGGGGGGGADGGSWRR